MKRLIERKKGKSLILEKLMIAFFNEFPDCDRAIIEIKEDKDSRSTNQNNLYWEWISVIGNELGYTKDETHILLRDKFLGYNEVTTKKGEAIKELKSTASMNVKEFAEYMEQVDMFIVKYGIILPRPNGEI